MLQLLQGSFTTWFADVCWKSQSQAVKLLVWTTPSRPRASQSAPSRVRQTALRPLHPKALVGRPRRLAVGLHRLHEAQAALLDLLTQPQSQGNTGREGSSQTPDTARQCFFLQRDGFAANTPEEAGAGRGGGNSIASRLSHDGPALAQISCFLACMALSDSSHVAAAAPTWEGVGNIRLLERLPYNQMRVAKDKENHCGESQLRRRSLALSNSLAHSKLLKHARSSAMDPCLR